MSDKFFFKGRQDSRENHVKSGFQTKANAKPGSKKYPLSLRVTSKTRQQEVLAMVNNAGLYADIHIDLSENAKESIVELTTLLNKTATIKLSATPSRNAPCSCGSGKKYKKCCGSAV